MHKLDLLHRDSRARRLEDLVAHDGARLRKQTVDRRTGDDAVIVIRIALRFHQAHPSASGARLEIALCRGAAVVAGNDLFPSTVIS